MRVLVTLLEYATRPPGRIGEYSPYMTQAEVRQAAFPQRVVGDNMMDDVITCAAIMADKFLPGSSLQRSHRFGYWLADAAMYEEHRETLGKIKAIATKGDRAYVQLNAAGNGPIARSTAAKLRRMLDDPDDGIYRILTDLEDMLRGEEA
jgi:hypothetical protein